MHILSPVTESIVSHHLRAFLDQKGIDAILADYDENARFHSEAKTYIGKQEIRTFFQNFIASLPAGSIERFSLRGPASRWRTGLHHLERRP